MVPKRMTETLIFGAFSVTVKTSGSLRSSFSPSMPPTCRKPRCEVSDVAFQRLHIVAVAMGKRDVAVVRLAHDRFDLRQLRRVFLRLAHIGKDHAAGFLHPIGDRRRACRIFGFVLEIWWSRHLPVTSNFQP